MRSSVSRRVASIAVFATIYAIMNQFLVSHLIVGSGSLTFGEVFSPLAGMVLGPVAGPMAVFLGTYESVALGHPLSFAGFDFIPPVAAAFTAGLAVKKDTLKVVFFSLALALAFSLDPFSLPFMNVGGFIVPYFWMQLVALVVLTALLFANKSGLRFASNDVLVVAIVFLATMNAEVAGGLMYENVFVLAGFGTADNVVKAWPIIFYLYPLERTFFTVAGALLAAPVLRALPTRLLENLRGSARDAQQSPGPSA